MLKIFIGYDQRQAVSYQVLSFSIISRATRPVTISPIGSQYFKCKDGLTPFTFARFHVPRLCNYEGQALFLDADIMVRDDISKLFDLCPADADVDVYVRKSPMKFEWASVMMFNCDRCRLLTPDYIEKSASLHGIGWSDDVGAIPDDWNHLVGYDAPNPNAKLVHFTQGVPAWPETAGTEFADEWNNEARASMSAVSWFQLMGRSVHAQHVVDRLRQEGKVDVLKNLKSEYEGMAYATQANTGAAASAR